MTKRSGRADLCFVESRDPFGFTPLGVSSFRDKNPVTVVRELIQNSLDAAIPVRGDGPAIVRFSLASVPTRKIPGLDSYRIALDRAVKRWTENGELPDQADMIVDTIEQALDRESQDVLVVSDNGVGLDDTLMRALLSDGASAKPDGSSGAFGVGHLSVFPVSDLRYILYGGIRKGGTIASGHAILASHYQNDKDNLGRSGHGYLLAGRKDRDDLYLKNAAIPDLIRDHLDTIKKLWGHGTVVIVPGFNFFQLDKNELWDAIAKTATCHFSPALVDKHLRIEFNDTSGESVKVIDHETVKKFIDPFRSHPSGSGGFPSGLRLGYAFEVAGKGVGRWVDVGGGERVEIRVMVPSPSDSTRVNVFRNGMWITSADKSSGGPPGFHNHFANRKPFEAVILIRAADAPNFHNLVRLAEGPEHRSLSKAAVVRKGAWKELSDGFRCIRNFLDDLIPESNTESTVIDDFLAFSEDPSDSAGRSEMGWEFRGTVRDLRAQAATARQRRQGEEPSNRLGKRSKQQPRRRPNRNKKPAGRPKLPENFHVAAAPAGNGRWRFAVRSTEDHDEAELRLIVDDRPDVMTDRMWEDELAILTEATIDGKKAPAAAIRKKPHPALSLGRLEHNRTVQIELACSATDSADRAHSYRVVIAPVDTRNEGSKAS